MTLPAFEKLPEAIFGPGYTVGPRCSVPGCGKLADHGHHIVRRSATGKPAVWVRTEEGEVLGNLTGLCAPHHDDITGKIGGHRAAIRYIGHAFWWCTVAADGRGSVRYTPVATLDPQPPSPDSLRERRLDEDTETDVCPECGQAQTRRPRPAAVPGEPPRRRKTWTIDVPDDEEDGATILDILIDDLAPILGYDVRPKTRYFTVVSSLVHAQHDKRHLIRSLQGKGE